MAADHQFAFAVCQRTTDQRVLLQNFDGSNDFANALARILYLMAGQMIEDAIEILRKLRCQLDAGHLQPASLRPTGASRSCRPCGFQIAAHLRPRNGFAGGCNASITSFRYRIEISTKLRLPGFLGDRFENEGMSGRSRVLAAAATRAFRSSGRRMVVVGMPDSRECTEVTVAQRCYSRGCRNSARIERARRRIEDAGQQLFDGFGPWWWKSPTFRSGGSPELVRGRCAARRFGR